MRKKPLEDMNVRSIEELVVILRNDEQLFLKYISNLTSKVRRLYFITFALCAFEIFDSFYDLTGKRIAKFKKKNLEEQEGA